MACALGAMVSSGMLSERADHVLIGLDRVAWLAIGVGTLAPPLMIVLERGVRRRERHVDEVDEPAPPSVA